jgi:hypothetical protein
LIADRLTPAKARACADGLLASMARTTQADRLAGLASGVGRLEARLPAREALPRALRAADRLGDLLVVVDAEFAPELAYAFSELLPLLPADEAQPRADRPAPRFADALAGAKTDADLLKLVSPLWALAPHLSPQRAAAVADRLVAVLAEPGPWEYELQFASLLEAIRPRLDPEAARRYGAKVFALLLERLANPKNPYTYLLGSLEAFADAASPEQAARTVGASLNIVERSENALDVERGLGTVKALAGRLTEEARSSAAARVLELVGKNREVLAYAPFSLTYRALSDRLSAAEAVRGAERLTELQVKAPGLEEWACLAEASAEVASRLTAAQARGWIDRAEVLLPEAGRKVPLSLEARPALSEFFRRAAQRLPPDQAAVLPGRLALLASRCGDLRVLVGVEAAFRAVADRAPPGQRQRWAEQAAAPLIAALDKADLKTSPEDFVPALTAVWGRLTPAQRTRLLSRAAESLDEMTRVAGDVRKPQALFRALPPICSDQQLIDLLKRPLCVADAADAVLSELGRRCDRPEARRRADDLPALLGPLGGRLAREPAMAFDDLWDAVDWLREHRPELDLTSPPHRSEDGG